MFVRSLLTLPPIDFGTGQAYAVDLRLGERVLRHREGPAGPARHLLQPVQPGAIENYFAVQSFNDDSFL